MEAGLQIIRAYSYGTRRASVVTRYTLPYLECTLFKHMSCNFKSISAGAFEDCIMYIV